MCLKFTIKNARMLQIKRNRQALKRFMYSSVVRNGLACAPREKACVVGLGGPGPWAQCLTVRRLRLFVRMKRRGNAGSLSRGIAEMPKPIDFCGKHGIE
jgi:hypothetical protein